MGHFEAGLKSRDPGYRFESVDGYDHLQVIGVLSGRLLLSTDGRDSAIGPGEAAVLGTGSRFTLACRGTGYRGAFLIAWQDFPGDPGCAVHVSGCPALGTIAGLLAAEAESPGAGGPDQLLDLGRAMARIAVRHARDGGVADPAAPARWWAERTRLALEANLRTGEHPRAVLAPLGLSYRQLSRHLQAVEGFTPKRLQLRLRLAAAARLLETTAQQVTDIALELGFPSSQHFATCFRAAYRASPQEWRRRASGKRT